MEMDVVCISLKWIIPAVHGNEGLIYIYSLA